MYDIITQLKNTNNLKIYLDFRAGIVDDLSGNSKNGSFSGGSKLGRGFCAFDGVNGVITVGSVDANIRTVIVSIKPNNVTGTILELVDNTKYITYTNRVVSHTGLTSPTFYVDGIAGTTIDTTKFSFVALTDTADINVTGLNVGEGNNAYFNGLIEYVLLINRVLSATEISQIYSQLSNIRYPSRQSVISKPSLYIPQNSLVGSWDMGNSINTTIPDDTGNGFNLTINGGAVVSNSSIGKCLSFDGINDSASKTNVGNVKTISLWINPINANDGLLELINNNTYLSIVNNVITQTNFTVPTIYVNGIAVSTIKTGIWNHVVLTTNTAVNSTGFNVGESNGDFYQGLIKDVRCWNRALTQQEISNIYNSGKTAMYSSGWGVNVSGGNET